MARHAHFIGVGGIGMSALAQWYQGQGWTVTGSDAASSVVTDFLSAHGIPVMVSPDGGQVPEDAEQVIYSTAVPDAHPERLAARERGVQAQSYPEALGAVTAHYKTIAICGTHGKSTTTAMTALLLIAAGLDPTVIVGTRMDEFGGNNFRAGASPWLVIEADEYKKAFLYHHPYIVACLNVEADHLDVYRSFDEIKDTFLSFFTRVSPGGALVVNTDDAFLSRVRPPEGVELKGVSSSDGRARELQPLAVPGEHNRANARAADAIGEVLGVDTDIRTQALRAFSGTWRRFEHKGTWRGAQVYDDYAHHPTEVRAALSGARERYPDSRIVCVFQPHQTHRLDLLFDDFVRAFQDADVVIVTETYRVKGREDEHVGAHTAAELASAVETKKPAVYAADLERAHALLEEEVKAGDVIVFMGAGDITALATRLTT